MADYMTLFPDSNVERSEGHPENRQDILPPTERSQDPAITEAMRGLSVDAARPLTDDERKVADRDAPAGERVYAPASERVPVDPVPGHREFTDHTDTHTLERQAAGQTRSASGEPSFARVNRPTNTPGASSSTPQQTFGTHDDAAWNSGAQSGGGFPLAMLSWVGLGVAAAIGGWLVLRWQRERNKPVNRLRRQAKQAAGEIRGRVPSTPEEAVKPAAGLTTALLSILILLWRRAQARSWQADQVAARQGKKAGKATSRATEAISDMDWQKRLTTLNKRWKSWMPE